jgi:hypothetical protein
MVFVLISAIYNHGLQVNSILDVGGKSWQLSRRSMEHPLGRESGLILRVPIGRIEPKWASPALSCRRPLLALPGPPGLASPRRLRCECLNRLAGTNGIDLGRREREIFSRSNRVWMPSQNSGVVPKQRAERKAVSGVTGVSSRPRRSKRVRGTRRRVPKESDIYIFV